MLTTKNLGRNILIALLIAKGTKLLFVVLMRSIGVEVGTYGPVIGWTLAALVLLWLCRREPVDTVAS